MRSAVGKGMLLALAAACVSGCTVFVNSYGVAEFSSATVYTTAKNAVAGVVLLAVLVPLAMSRTGGRGLELTRPQSGRQLLGLAVVAVVGGGVAFVLFFEGLSRIASDNTALQAQFIQKTLVIWVAVLAVVLLRERVGPLQLVAVAVLVTGQAVLAGGGSAVFHISFGRGEYMVLAATVLWSIETVVAKTLLAALSPWTIALTRMVGGSALLIAWVTITGNASQLLNMSGDQWKWVLATGAGLALYVALWFAALSLAPAVSVTAVLVAAVPVTAVLDAMVKHEPLRPQLDGQAIVLVGAALAFVATLLTRRLQPVRVAAD
ncbi:MAG TPA: DMT family transporter [Jatrophihabitans sp.]|nr:DMT family transporter [Jatrophihabitans sp.]